MKQPTRILFLLLAASALAGCGTRRPPAPSAAPLPVRSAPLAGDSLVLDCAASTLRVLVRREGALASLGHNHVLLLHPAAGEFRLSSGAAVGSFEFAVDAAQIDEPAARAVAGPEFPGVVPADDIAGTRRNLLGPAVLDSAQWPRIRVEVASVSGGPEPSEVAAYLTVRDHRTPVAVPVQVTRQGEVVVASGELGLSQRALGLEPFSVLFGALRVADRLDTSFHLVLRPLSQSTPETTGCRAQTADQSMFPAGR
jgi:polyisoprenoid-binding protein YceI